MATPASTAAGTVARRCGGGRPVLDEVALPAGELAGGRRERERRVGGDLRVGEPTEPAFDGRLAPVTDRTHDVVPDELSRALDVAAADRMMQRAVEVARPLMPVAGTAVELLLDLGLAPVQLSPQHLAEQPVVAVALVGAVERDEQQVRPRQRGQRGGRARSAQHGVAERARQRVEHRRSQHELELLRREAGEDLVAEVVRHQPIVAAEPVRRRRPGVLVERQGRERQSGRPPLGAAQECLHAVAVELESRELEQRRSLAPGHREVARSELRDEPLLTEASDREGEPAA